MDIVVSWSWETRLGLFSVQCVVAVACGWAGGFGGGEPI